MTNFIYFIYLFYFIFTLFKVDLKLLIYTYSIICSFGIFQTSFLIPTENIALRNQESQ